jgi:hypothetical protein
MYEPNATTTGINNTIIQVVGDNNRIRFSPETTLYLAPVRRPGELRVKSEIDILDPDFQAVPLLGRDADLQLLTEWLQGGGIKVMALVGEGGSGKTRLAIELLNSLNDNWQGGFLLAAEAARFPFHQNLSTWIWPKDTLVVVDYAATMRTVLSTWLLQLAGSNAEKSLRILLLERYANVKSGWFSSLTDGLNSSKGARDLLDPIQPKHIAPIVSLAHRRSILASGLQVLTKLKEGSAEAANSVIRELPELSEAPWFVRKLSLSQWADPLLLLMAAIICHAAGVHDALDVSQLAAVEGFAQEVEDALSMSRVEVAKKVAAREASRLMRFARNETEKRILVHLYACVILCGELDPEQATQIAKSEFEALQLNWTDGAGAAVRELQIATSQDSTLRRLRPDLLAEAFLLMDEHLFDGKAVRRMGKINPKQLAQIVILSARDFAGSDEIPLTWLQIFLGGGQEDFEVLTEIDAAIPPQTEIMRAFAVQASRCLLVLASEKHSIEKTVWSLAIVAGYLANYSVKLGRIGDLSAALEAGEEAVALYRELYERDPSTFRADLALTLNNLSGQLSAVGRKAEALEAIESAVKLRRELFEAEPESFQADLANSLCNLANQLSGVGHRDEALEASKESVKLYQPVYEANPGRFRADLGSALTTLSAMQNGVGDIRSALDSSRQSARLYRTLSEEDPDAYRAFLATALNNQSCCEGAAGDIESCLTSVRESVGLYRELFKGHPEAFRDGLAAALNNLSGTQSELNQFEDALTSAEEAVVLYREVYVQTPAAVISRLASSLNNLANRLGDLGQLEAALRSSEESVELRRAGFADEPEVFRVELARSLSVLGDRLWAVGRRSEARQAAAEALEVMAPSFLRWPDVARRFTRATLNDYLFRTRELGLEPAEELTTTYRSSIAEADDD